MRSAAQRSTSRSRIHCRLLAAAAAAAALAMVAAGCSSSGNSTSTGNTPVKGGTAVWAEPPSSPPTYIFPYIDSANISNLNLFDFQYLMYRPLYWFGQNGQPVVNPSLSLASLPKVSGRTLTITLKHYMWSNGTQVTAQDVMFWLNMELAEPDDYGAYTGFPKNVSNIKVVSPTTITMTMDQSYSPTWFLYNELSQVTPMPAAWDRTASGPSSCATKVSDCAAVYNYLNAQAKDETTYASSPIWGIVDGPWKLSSFSSDGHVTYVPNKSYSGPVKPKLDEFKEVPFTTDSAEYDVLQSPSSTTKIDFGYLPDQDAPAKPAERGGRRQPAARLHAGPAVPLGHRLLRDELPVHRVRPRRHLQAAVLPAGHGLPDAPVRDRRRPLRGYGSVTVGPVAATPVTKWLSATGRKGDPFPYNPAKAKSLLSSHGWTVTPNGTDSCTDPAKCGPGISKGSTLNFNFIYESGVSWVGSEMTQLQSNAAAAGIKLNLIPKPFADVISVSGGNCVVIKSSCAWDLANWGFGWSFSPDYLPTGDELFQCGAVANSGGYCDKTNDAMINKTLTSANLVSFVRKGTIDVNGHCSSGGLVICKAGNSMSSTA